MRGVWVVGSPRAGCDRCCSFAKVVVVSSKVVDAVDVFDCAVDVFDDGQWRLCVRRLCTFRLCVGGFC